MQKKMKLMLLVLLMPVIFISTFIYPAEVEFPLLQSMSYFPYRDNSLIEKGTVESSLELSYSNLYTFNHTRTSFSDFEMLGTTLGIRYGLTEKSVVEVYFRHAAIFGGKLDKFIEDFHSTFKLPDADRPLYPRNIVQYQLGDHFNYTDGTGGIAPVILSYLRELAESEGFQLKGRLSIGIPLSSKPGFSSGKPSFTAGLVAGYQKKWFGIELSNYVSFLKSPSWLEGEDLRSNMFYSRLEINAFHFIAGLNFRTSAFRVDDVSDNAYQIYVGYRITSHIEFIFQEDFAPFNTTPDIGFNLRIRF